MVRFIKRITSIIGRWVPLYFKYLLYFLDLHLFNRDLLRKDIWLICEKYGEARDNGYHFFRYLRINHPEINAYFVITKNSIDIKKVEPFGNLIFNDSREHYLYYLAAKYSINSQCSGAYPAIMIPEFFNITRHLRRKGQKCIFLQHGITKDKVLQKDWFYSKHIIDMFSVSLDREQIFVETEYGYPCGIVKKVGLCRFDALYRNGHNPKKQILVMPTWRKWLNNSGQSFIDAEQFSRFMLSDFYKNYLELLLCDRLTDILKKHGYKLIFFPHYAFQGYLDAFNSAENEFITLASSSKYDVQTLLIESAVLITDYSSVFFDFAYMEKPEIFFQFDSEEYRAKHYGNGYFNYETDAFGPILHSVGQVLDELERVLSRNCVMKEPYITRCKNEFASIDDKNCERTFLSISKLEKA